MINRKDFLKELRKKAEALSLERNRDIGTLSVQETRELLHELQVHQIELELQNEELRRAQQELETSHERFLQLFHKAPVGYISLDSVGIIRQANETFCNMLEQEMKNVVGRPFSKFVFEPERNSFIARYRAIYKTPGGKNMELTLLRNGKRPFDAGIEAAVMPLLAGAVYEQEEPRLLITVSDITEQKQNRRALQQSEEKYQKLYRQLDEEMNKARTMHERTLPQTLPSVEGLAFAAHYKPARMLGGDFYDVILSGDKLVIFISDVTGHGLDGAMLSVFVKEAVDSFVSLRPEDMSPGRILQHLDRQFRRENYPDDYFICIFIAVLDLQTMELCYSGAGFHDTLLVGLGDGSMLELVAQGLFLAPALPDEVMEFQEDRVFLTPGSTVFFTTDGLTEQEIEGKMYGEKLPALFYDCCHLPPDEIVETVIDDFRRFNNGSLQGDDDITFLVMQVEG